METRLRSDPHLINPEAPVKKLQNRESDPMMSRMIHPMIFVESTGDVSLEEVQKGFVGQILPAVAESKVSKVLIDGTRCHGKGRLKNDFERFLYGQFIANAIQEFTKQHGIVPKVAYVLHEPLQNPHHFVETVAGNRGMNVKVFDTHADAIHWLHDSEAKS